MSKFDTWAPFTVWSIWSLCDNTINIIHMCVILLESGWDSSEPIIEFFITILKFIYLSRSIFDSKSGCLYCKQYHDVAKSNAIFVAQKNNFCVTKMDHGRVRHLLTQHFGLSLLLWLLLLLLLLLRLLFKFRWPKFAKVYI